MKLVMFTCETFVIFKNDLNKEFLKTKVLQRVK